MTGRPARERRETRDRVDATAPTNPATDSEASDRLESEASDANEGENLGADAAVARIRDRAATIRDREVETALAKLDARGDLSTADRGAVEAMADRLVARLVAVPERRLEAAASPDGESGEPADGAGGEEAAPVETVLELFG